MACFLEQLLDVERGVPEGSLRLPARRGKSIAQLVGVPRDPDAAAATARGRLNEDGIPDIVGRGERRLDVPGCVSARDHRNVRLAGEPARGRLVAHRGDRFRRGADEDDPGGVARLGEPRTLREEAVAGVNGVGARLARRTDQNLDVEVRVAGVRLTDRQRLVGLTDVERLLVGLGVHRHRRQVELPACAHDAPGDLATVRDQDLLHVRGGPPTAVTRRSAQRCPVPPRRGPRFLRRSLR